MVYSDSHHKDCTRGKYFQKQFVPGHGTSIVHADKESAHGFQNQERYEEINRCLQIRGKMGEKRKQKFPELFIPDAAADNKGG